jgi:hypothetical protein
MTPKDLFQTGLRIAGVILVFYTFPLAFSNLLNLFGPTVGGNGFLFVVLSILRILWDIGFPLWLISGAKGLTRALYGSA